MLYGAMLIYYSTNMEGYKLGRGHLVYHCIRALHVLRKQAKGIKGRHDPGCGDNEQERVRERGAEGTEAEGEGRTAAGERQGIGRAICGRERIGEWREVVVQILVMHL